MVQQIVVGQRLLNHGQVVFVQRLEHRVVAQPVSTVTVNVKSDFGKGLAHSLHHGPVPPGTKLQFHPLETCLHRALDGFEQTLNRLHDAEASLDLDRVRASAGQLPERFPPQFRLQIPPGEVQSGLGERVSLEAGEPRLQFFARFDFLPQKLRDKPIPHHDVDSSGPLGAILRRGPGCRFTPADDIATGHLHQDALNDIGVAIGSAKRVKQRHGHAKQGNRFNSHLVALRAPGASRALLRATYSDDAITTN